MNFTPLKFQGALAAGGVALMPFVYLQNTVPHPKGLIKLADIPFNEISSGKAIFFIVLLGIMSIFTIIHFVLTISFLKDLTSWLIKKEAYKIFINTPLTNIGIFSPVISLAMTMNVIFSPLSFFIPGLSSNIQVMMWPALIAIGILWMILFRFEIKLLIMWLSQPLELSKLNFGWLLDVFALGMVSLTATGIASMSNNKEIASIAAFLSLFTISFGLIIFVGKLLLLIYIQIKAGSLPLKQAQPTFFVVIPIICLFGVSLYKFSVYLEKYFLFDLKFFTYFIISSSFVLSIGWGIFCVYLLKSYFKNEFVKNEFYPGQWTIVCAFVGSEVLGSYVYGSFYKSPVLNIFNLASIFLASVIYVLVLIRYYQANAKDKNKTR